MWLRVFVREPFHTIVGRRGGARGEEEAAREGCSAGNHDCWSLMYNEKLVRSDSSFSWDDELKGASSKITR